MVFILKYTSCISLIPSHNIMDRVKLHTDMTAVIFYVILYDCNWGNAHVSFFHALNNSIYLTFILGARSSKTKRTKWVNLRERGQREFLLKQEPTLKHHKKYTVWILFIRKYLWWMTHWRNKRTTLVQIQRWGKKKKSTISCVKDCSEFSLLAPKREAQELPFLLTIFQGFSLSLKGTPKETPNTGPKSCGTRQGQDTAQTELG